MLSSHSLPDWCEQLTFSAPFLFPFETRQLYFYCTAFGSSRYSQDPGREWVYLESVFWSKYIIFGSGFKNLPLIWIRIRASSGLRQKITNILITVFSLKTKYKKYVQKLNLKKVPSLWKQTNLAFNKQLKRCSNNQKMLNLKQKKMKMTIT